MLGNSNGDILVLISVFSDIMDLDELYRAARTCCTESYDIHYISGSASGFTPQKPTRILVDCGNFDPMNFFSSVGTNCNFSLAKFVQNRGE